MTAPSQPSELAVGPYRLVKQLGSGGQGQVWRAMPVEGGPDVALKLFELVRDERAQRELRRRVDREFRALQGLQLPSIVGVVATGVHEEPGVARLGYLWTAYELVEGRDVGTMIEKGTPPQADKLLEFARALGSGLQHVHDDDLIHRDVKPANIILRRSRWTDPVLVDFGFTKTMQSSHLTRTGAALGTLGFMAPELLLSTPKPTALSDQWSFAKLLLRLVCWSHEIDGPIVDQEFISAEDVEEALSELPGLGSVLARALARDPDDRYEDVTSFVDAFEGALYDDGLLEAEEEEVVQYEGPTWDRRRTLASFVEGLGYRVIDNRLKKGALWVVGDNEAFAAVADHLRTKGVHFQFAERGGGATGHKPAWFTKSDG